MATVNARMINLIFGPRLCFWF